MGDNRLGEFLRAKRESLDPADIGLETNARRRTVGLRREEVAQRANVSIDYYTRLEQSRASNPSDSVLDSISTALKLDWESHSYLFRLAGRDVGFQRSTIVRPGIIKLLDRLDGLCAAMVVDHAGDVLAWNHLSAALFVDFAELDFEDRNMMILLLADTDLRTRIPDDERLAVIDAVVADFKAQSVRAVDQERIRAIVDRFDQPGSEFADAWHNGNVSHFVVCAEHVSHPDVGSIRLDVEFLDIADTGQRMIVYSASDDESQHRLNQLVAT